MTQIVKPGTTILDYKAVSSGAAITSTTGIVRELHPLPSQNVSASDVADPESLARTINSLHEAVRRATLSVRQDPASAPCYVRNVSFANTSNVAANVTVTIPHSLNRPHTTLHVTRSQGAPYAGFEVPNPGGQSPDTHVTVTTSVPAGTTALHDFKFCGD